MTAFERVEATLRGWILLPIAAFALVALSDAPHGATTAFGEDVVTIRTGRAGQESTRRIFGTIVDLRGGRMTVFRSGREESFDTSKIIRYETTHLPQQIEGDRLFRARNYPAALTQYREAVEREKRNWVRREILAAMTTCRRNLGQFDVACETFLIVYEADKQTRHLNAIPLAWRSERAPPPLASRAEEWLRADEEGAAQLMAASWLLSGPRRAQAVSALQSLTDNKDKRIAQLAQAQLWRTKLVTARETEAPVWEAFVERIPEDLRAGPYFMLGQLLSRLKKPEQAALAYLRTPVLFPHERLLCEQSLFAAAKELETIGQLDAARNIYRELLRDYVGSIYADEAKSRYQQLEEKRKKRATTQR